MPVDYSAKSVADLQTMLRNHEAKGKTDSDSYRAALAQLAARVTKGLSFDRTVAVIAEAAQKGEFVSYKALAEASGVKWNTANVGMSKHLLEVCEYSHRKGWPLLSAIVVSKDHVADGGMDRSTLAGFCKCARALDYVVDDEGAFLRHQQRDVFQAAGEGRLG